MNEDRDMDQYTPTRVYEDQHDEANVIWGEVMKAVKQTVMDTILKHQPKPTEWQLDFWHEQSADQMYNAGWNAIMEIYRQSLKEPT